MSFRLGIVHCAHPLDGFNGRAVLGPLRSTPRGYPTIVLGKPNKLECHLLITVYPLPNFGYQRLVLGVVPLLHHTPKFIRRWDCTPASTQLQKLVIKLPFRPLLSFRKFLEEKDQNQEGEQRVVLPLKFG